MRVEPLQSGGGQERGMRSGTVPTPLVVGLGAACELAQAEMTVSKTKGYYYTIPFEGIKVHTVYVIFSTITNTSTCCRITLLRR